MVTTKLARQSRNTKNAKQDTHAKEDFGAHDLAFVLVRAQMQMRKRNAQKRKSHTDSRELRARKPRHATSRLLKRKLAQRDVENRAPCVRVAESGRVGRDVLRNGPGKPRTLHVINVCQPKSKEVQQRTSRDRSSKFRFRVVRKLVGSASGQVQHAKTKGGR